MAMSSSAIPSCAPVPGTSPGRPARLTADADGVVTATLIESGQVVAAGQAAIRHARLAEKEAVVAIPEAQLAQARTGRASASLWSDPEKTYEAQLRELSPSPVLERVP